MAILLMFEGRDRKTYYECKACHYTCMVEKPEKCPRCKRKFTRLVDEVELTHNHNEACKALSKNPEDKFLFQETMRLGLERMRIEY